MSGQVTCPSKWPGWTQKQKGAVFSMKQGKMHGENTLLFKWIKIHLNSANTKQKECMVREVKRTDLGTKGQRRCLKACWLVDQCCRLLQFFPPILCWRSSSEFHLCNLRASLSLLVFCTFFFPVLQILYAKNESKDRKAVPAGLWFFVFPALSPFFFPPLSRFLCFLSLPLW